MKHASTLALGAAILLGAAPHLACGGEEEQSSAAAAGDASVVGAPAAGGSGGQAGDGGPGGSSAVVACGTTTCAIPQDACCVYDKGGGVYAFGCASSVDAGGRVCPAPPGTPGAGKKGRGEPPPGAALRCASTANCTPPAVCCISEVSGQVVSACQATCGGQSAQLCDKNAGAAAGCGDGGVCSSDHTAEWALPAGYATCGGLGR